MSKSVLSILIVAGCLLCCSLALADDHADMTKDSTESTGLDFPTGPTEEIKNMAHMVGTWDVKGRLLDFETEEWSDFEAVAQYSYIVEGAAIQMTYESQFAGMPFVGFYLQAFDRETMKWKSVWTDNFGSSISYMEGEEVDGNLVFNGKERWQGQDYLNRITVYNRTKKSFDWKMEHSMDEGKTYVEAMLATYTKR